MKSVGNFFNRLTSRKFMLTVAGIFAVTLFPEASGEIVALIIAFVGAEGAADAVSRYAVGQDLMKEATNAQQERIVNAAFGMDEDDEAEPDTTVITPGNYPL